MEELIRDYGLGEVNFSFPQSTTSEDRVEYCIYLPASKAVIEGLISREEQLLAARAAFLSCAQTLVGQYIWHHEPFNLSVHIDSSQGEGRRRSINSTSSAFPNDVAMLSESYLEGSVHFGDNLADEWVVAYILFELSKRHADLVISMTDNDGQFLLIEAADAVPDWLEPENSSNRVFVRSGRVHIVPDKPQKNLELHQALMALLQDGGKTEANGAIQALVQRRIRQVPPLLTESLHTVRCILPRDIAILLHQKPQLVAAASSAFCHREPGQTKKICNKMRRFEPKSKVQVMVPMTRWIYAELLHQHFFPPRVFDPMLPLPTAPGVEGGEEHPDAKAATLGVRLACGFELLYWEGERLSHHSQGTEKEESSQQQQKNGEYVERLRVALSSERYCSSEEAFSLAMAFGKNPVNSSLSDALSLYKLAAGLETSEKDLRGSTARPSFSQTLTADDKDDWLTVTPDEVEKMVQDRMHERAGRKEGVSAKEFEEDGANLEEIARAMEHFVNKVSSIEGVETGDPSGVGGDRRTPVSLDFTSLLKVLKGEELDEEPENELDDFFDDSVDSDDEEEEPFNEMEIEEQKRRQASLSANNSHQEHKDQEKEVDDNIDIYVRELQTEDSDDEDLQDLGNQELETAERGTMGTLEEKTRTKAESSFHSYLEAMDAQLEDTAMGQTFMRQGTVSQGVENVAQGQKDQPNPVEVDLNLVANLLESFSHQQGLEGPGANLLRELGLRLPSGESKG